MNITEIDYNLLLQKMKESSETVAEFIIEKNNQDKSVQLYLELDVNDENNSVDGTSLVATNDFVEKSKNIFLLHSQENKKYVIQNGLNVFNELDYKDKAKALLKSMLSDQIYSSSVEELNILVSGGLLKLVDKNEDLFAKYEAVGADKAFEIFEKQYIETKAQPELTYELHSILDELLSVDHSKLSDKYDLTLEELEFLQVASKISSDRVMELISDFLDEKIVKVNMVEPKTLEDIKREEGFNNPEKSVLYLTNITATIYDMYHLESSTEFTPEKLKEAIKNVVDSFTKNKVSLYYLMDSMEKNNGFTEDSLKMLMKGFPEPVSDGNSRQLSITLDEELTEGVEIKPLNLTI